MASDKQAEDIILLDARKACSFTDYIVICSGETDRQIDAIFREIEDGLKKLKVKMIHREGDAESGWILIDYFDIVVHIFSREVRKYYNLETLYEKAPKLINVQ